MLADLGISENQFGVYLLTFKTYRDKFLAHLDDEKIMNIPVLDFATESIRYLCDHLRSEHPEWFNGELPLMGDYYRACCAESQQIFAEL